MSHKKIKIPVIAITPEAEEDDDHNYRTLADALTDVETLEFDTEPRIRHSVDKGRHKLIIKLGDDGAITDTEDVEGSGDEIETKIVAHEKPVSIDDLDLDPGTCKETHKVRSRGTKGKKKLHTQSSTVTEPNAHLNLDGFLVHDGTTDVEDYSASEDDAPVRHFKESNVLAQMLDVSINTKILDKFAQKKKSPVATPCDSDAEEFTSKKLTDVENLDSDSNSERGVQAQNKKVKRRRQKPKHDAYDTDEENFEFRSYKTNLFGDKKHSDDSNASSSNEGGRYDIKFKSPSVEVKSLLVPQSNVDEHTDVEALDSNDEQGAIDIPVAIVKRCRKGYSTEEEVLSDTDVSYHIKAVSEVSIPRPFRKIVTLRETSSDRPVVTITPIDDDYVPGLRQYYHDATDEECFSDTEALLFAEALSRGATPDFSIFEGGFDDISESVKIRRKSLRNASPSLTEVLTDTEDLFLGVGRNKKKAPTKYLSTLTVSRPERQSLTDTEDLCLSDYDRETRRRTISDGGTDLESLAMSDDEYLNEKVDLLRALSTTPISMREMGGDTVLSKEGSGPISDNSRLQINRRVQIMRSANTSPMVTDTEEMFASDDDDLKTRVDSVTPLGLRKQLDEGVSSKVHTQNTHKIDLDAPHEVMYLKGGSYREVHTDVEDVNVSDDDYACSNKKKFSVDILSDNNVLVSMKKSCANVKDCPGPCHFKNGKEWDATTGKPSADGLITAKGKSAVDAGKGEASAVSPSESAQARQPAPFRGVEEGDSEVPAQGPSSHSSQRFVSDQQQLSEEMKQLLRDMEEETKK